MRAVIVATGERQGMTALTRQYPIPMLPLLNRPFLHHVVEHLVERGVTQIDFVLSNLPEKIEGNLGTGERWGAEFRYHLARDASQPYNLIRGMDLGEEGDCLLIGHADRLPNLPLDSLPATAGRTAPALFCHGRNGRTEPAAAPGAGEAGPLPDREGMSPPEAQSPKMPFPEAQSTAARPPVAQPSVAQPGSPTSAPVALARPVAAVKDSVDPAPAPTRLAWSGWAILNREDVAALPADLDEAGFETYLLDRAEQAGSVVSIEPPLSLRSYDDVLDAHRRALTGGFNGLIHSAREVEKGIWLSRNVALHPTVKLVPPVFIGENCRISIGTQLGPNATINNDCVIDGRCLVSESIVFRRSFVGEALELEGSLVDRNRLISARIGTDVTVPESFILGSLSDHNIGRSTRRIVSQVMATVALGLTLPLLAGTALALWIFRKGPVFHRKTVVSLPSSRDEAQWRTFELLSFRSHSIAARPSLGDLLLRFLPGLGNVARGEIGFTGQPPRTRAELSDLPGDWKDFYIPSQGGLVTEADILGVERSCDDEHYAMEAIYAVNNGARYNLRLLARYFGGIFSGTGK